ncbi:hypothetical protein L596_018285 [Steinernema carpocapsae]|uniref:Uncharacterized protein n=1 Tax=Steinernema carpocapsae TaxID=34508 RepID=A0A4U5N482_STECR|nr:hypothetical protein L596_018285 [Steinernema carpocapsae]
MSRTGKPTAQQPAPRLKWLPPETEMAPVWRCKLRLVSVNLVLLQVLHFFEVLLNHGQFMLAHKPLLDDLGHLLAVIVEPFQRSFVLTIFTFIQNFGVVILRKWFKSRSFRSSIIYSR